MTGTDFPAGFLWGAAGSAHQTEGNNVASDLWWIENQPDSRLSERSGDACDSYHRWGDDLDLVAGAGLNAYRFSLEWARVEPVQGHISLAQLAHYRAIVEGCFERGITPVVTLHHFTNPAWFGAAGGWASDGAVEAFTRYVAAVAPILDGVGWVCTINEPNVYAMLLSTLRRANGDAAEHGVVAGALPEPDDNIVSALLAAHQAARETLAGIGGLRSGWTIANQNFQAPSDEPAAADAVAEWAWPREDRFIAAAAHDDFVGVQAYTRTIVGVGGPRDVAPGARRTAMGWEFYPAAAADAVRHTASIVDVPVLVTENGIATDDDAERIEYTRAALAGVAATISDGIDLRGYLHWSLLDNYEWGSYRPRFGLVEVDRSTFARRPKPSLRWLGALAAANRLG